MSRKSFVAQNDYCTQVIKGEIPCDFLFQDDQCVVFDGDDPQSPVHFLVVPKNLTTTFEKFNEEDSKLLDHLLVIAKDMAVQKGLHKTGYHVTYSEDYSSNKRRPVAIHVFGRALHHMVLPVGL